ncbi:nickel pincer cofactor biosynthesis protein LarC [Staphylococcus pasteuri]|nr:MULTISPECIES: nickel pincer cofactor biosynthesis protein LarC [Staphylococcus]ODB68566.1 TIGR00299 family protein [Staphylococcus sp. AOAB]RQX27271.1 nickel pincer cofactor biosynthesis protein LarC [Staphylococcus warneri]MCD9066200.1 nickel pincer cofactor biosynthesis protein LarC [Staphylococcus pasteuri]MCO0862061.1 nickel pincer cofactor biosynthesis protein LarC [Staphylococcus pasteuri]MCO5360885.1 nickel pincer cofactor biosynthesis protein LarC [Staphylococcus pasteuri]
MSNALYLDCHAGIAGDMLLSALVDIGANPQEIENELKKLPIDTFSLHFNKVMKQGIQATSLKIDFEESHHHRKASDIYNIIDNSTLNDRVKTRSKAIFNVIAHAEAKIHGMSVDEVHFHEVGAMDSIIDIIGGCIALELLDIDILYCSPIPTGNGRIKIAHGVYPIPAPATAEILKGIPLAQFNVSSELTTPTGAAFAKSLVNSFGTFPANTMKNIGYGAGTKEFDFPNVLRVIQFEVLDQQNEADQVQVIECQIDDMTAEMLGDIMENTVNQKVLDIFYTPIIMKKQRPATQLTVICKPDYKSTIEDFILTHTSTLGVRSYTVNRRILSRQYHDIETPYGNVSVKLAYKNDELIKAKPEFDQIKEIAKKYNQNIQTIYQQITKCMVEQLNL